MSTKIEIVNYALTMFGHKRVSSLAANNEITRTVNAVYPIVLTKTLESLNWSFARRQAELVLIAETADGVQPIDGWDYLYAVPTRCLKPRVVYADGSRYKAQPDPFIECLNPDDNTKAIASDIVDALCEFTLQVTDESQFDGTFVDAFAAHLASKLALPLTADKQLASSMYQIYKAEMSEAARLNIRRSRDKKKVSSSFITARG